MDIATAGLGAHPAVRELDNSRDSVVVVGSWIDVDRDHCDAHPMPLIRAPAKTRQLQQIVAAHRPSWLLIANGLDEEATWALIRAARAVSPELRTAMLGPERDAERCGRWARRGCTVYLNAASSAQRVFDCLEFANTWGVLVIDSCYYEVAKEQQIQPTATLTRREVEVLQLLRRGMRNAEMAKELHVAQTTVEFHVRNLLEKLAARNRVEVIERATRLGL